MLFDHRTGWHARGEVYYWLGAVAESGYAAEYHSELELQHLPKRESAINEWMHSLVTGFDLSFTHRAYRERGRYPSRVERLQAVSVFRSWIELAVWPAEVDVASLIEMLDGMKAVEFGDKIRRDTPARITAWRRLMRSDLRAVLSAGAPELTR